MRSGRINSVEAAHIRIGGLKSTSSTTCARVAAAPMKASTFSALRSGVGSIINVQRQIVVGTGLNVRPEQRSKVVRPSKSLAILCLDYTMLIALERGHRGIIVSKERTCSWRRHCQMGLASGPRLTEQGFDVLLDSAFAHRQLACDVAARSASRDKAEHFCLFLREDRERYARVALHMRSTPSLAPKADQVSCHDSCPPATIVPAYHSVRGGSLLCRLEQTLCRLPQARGKRW